MIDGYINTATLKQEMPNLADKSCFGCYVEQADSYVLAIPFPDKTLVLSKWRSDKPRFFVRADSLITEARKFGFTSINFGDEADQIVG